MKNECSIVQDLLPLYADHILNADTAAFVEEHLKGCASCKKEYDGIKEPQPAWEESSDAAPLLMLRRKMKMKRIQTAALTALFVIALLVSAFAVLDAPIYLPYSDDLVSVEALGDRGILLTFDKEVTAFDCTVYRDSDSEDSSCCEIEAWTSLWDKWFSPQNASLSTTVRMQGAEPLRMIYSPNDNTESICIAKYDPNAENRIERTAETLNRIVLPRLTLNYYFILAAVLLMGLGVVWLIFRKKAKVRVWTERIAFYPLAYIVSHCIVSGFHWDTYALARDFSLTVFLSILLYGGLLLAHNVLLLKKEIKETNP